MRAVLLFALLASAQDPADLAWQNTLRLAHVKSKVAAALASQPDFTCLATFDRFYRPAGQSAERRLDTVRVEVAYVGGKELYSWPGANSFSDTPLTRMIGAGMVGDGDFAVHAHNVFVAGGGVVTYIGPEGNLLRWDYRISPYQSGWTVSREGASQTVGSAGSFWVDAQTLELVRMDNHATDFLPLFPLQAADSRVDYGKVHIGQQDVLMPVRGEMTTRTLEDSENRNVIQYTGCREYAGQSTISFGALPEPTVAKPVTQIVSVPAGLTLKLRLTADLNLNRAVVGDRIEATLLAPLRDPTHEIAPKSATVRGRILLIDRLTSQLGIAFDELEFQGHAGRFSAALQSFDSLIPGISLTDRRGSEYSGQVLTRTEISLSKMPGASVFFAQSGLPKGTLMTWLTQ